MKAQLDPEQILRKPRKKKPSLPEKSVDNGRLELEARSHSAVQLGTLWEGARGYHPIGLPDRPASPEDPEESWYRDVGYLTALDESAIAVLEQVLPRITMKELKRQLHKTLGDRALGLRDRNVRVVPSLPIDPFLAEFDHMESHDLPDLHENVKQYHMDEWRLDLQKAINDELEATFQRTVMISMLDRFRLIYNLTDEEGPILDFAVESSWRCPFMPTRALEEAILDRQRILSPPKPDVSIAFHLDSIIEDGLMLTIPEAIRRIMVYEGSKSNETRTQRAFPFLMIEAKNADKTSDDKDGQFQGLNSASQSLHCLYEFFNEADREEVECNKPCCPPQSLATTTDESTSSARQQSPSHAGEQSSSFAKKDTFVARFFNEVRVFTAVPTSREITIRVHRACLTAEPPFPSHEGRPLFKPPILPDYPLQFEYNEVIKLRNDDREKLVDTFKKIMVDYGIGQLRPLLKDAAKEISKKFYTWHKNKGKRYVFGMRHYSHGQTAPRSQQNSRATTQATRSSASAISNSQPSIISATSPAAHHSFNIQPAESLPNPPKKRTRMR